MTCVLSSKSHPQWSCDVWLIIYLFSVCLSLQIKLLHWQATTNQPIHQSLACQSLPCCSGHNEKRITTYTYLSLLFLSLSLSLSLYIYIWCSCRIKVSCFSHLYSRYVGKWAGETQPWVIAFGTVREYAHKHIQASLCWFSNHNHQEQHRRSWWGKHRGYFDIFWAFWSSVININEDFTPRANSERRDAGLAQTLWP